MSKDDPFIWNYLENEGNYEQEQLKSNSISNNSYETVTYENNNGNNLYEKFNKQETKFVKVQKLNEEPEYISTSYNYLNGDIKEKEIINYPLNENSKNNENNIIWETLINNSNQYQPYEINYNSSNDQVYLNNKNNTGIQTNNNEFGATFDFNAQNNYVNQEDKKMRKGIEEQLYNSFFDNNQQFGSNVTFEHNNLENFEQYLF